VPTFCRHNRFIERCPICSKTLPSATPERTQTKRSSARSSRPRGEKTHTRPRGAERIRVQHQTRSPDDGYRSSLAQGLRSSHDAQRLAQEISFSCGRLRALSDDPPDLYGELIVQGDIERTTWACFLSVYLSPLQDGDPFRAIREVIEQTPDWSSEQLPELDGVELGPRSAHDPSRGNATLEAYRRLTRNSGSQRAVFAGEDSWSPERRFQRVFDRLALPGFGRDARFELLVILGGLGLYQLQADSLFLIAAGRSTNDATVLAAKRVFGIGDAANLERRVLTFSHESGVPLQALDLALANWGAEQRVTLGFPEDTQDQDAQGLAEIALGL